MTRISLCLMLISLCAVPSISAEITVPFTGYVNLVTGDMLGRTPDTLDETPVTGSFTYDTDVADTDSFIGSADEDPTAGYFLHGATGGLSLEIADREITGAGGMLFRVDLLSHYHWFRITAGDGTIYGTSPLMLNGVEQSELNISMLLVDPDQTAWASDDLPDVFPAGAFLDDTHPDQFTVTHNGETLHIQLETINGVPEPGSMGLLLVGAAAILRRRRAHKL